MTPYVILQGGSTPNGLPGFASSASEVTRMKITLLLLWGLISAPLQNTDCACQGGAGFGGPNGAYANGDGYGAFNSPVMDCRNGRCRSCCKDSTCNMYQHFPYQPDNHGYYYFRPYNYTMVWKHQQWIANLGADPRNPYTRAMFVPVYEQFENTTYEPDHKPSSTLSVLPHVGKQLPDLETLIKAPMGDMGDVPMAPAPGVDTTPTPAPPPETNN
jgi:hypothetical protein